MIRLKDLLEAKQVGDIYHFTPLSNVPAILKSQYMVPNDENQISTTRWADMRTVGFQDMQTKPVARFMFDGNKISTKYQIRPFSFSSGGEDQENLGEEQIVVDGRNFYFMPYLKRIDIFVQKGNPNLDKTLAILDKMNITYSVYQGTTHSNIPYKQSKEGDTTQIQYDPKPKEILITTKFIEHPYSPYKSYEFTNNPQTYPLPDDSFPSNMTKPHYRVRPISIFGDIWDYTPKYPNFYVKYSKKFSYDYVQKQTTYKESKPMPWSNDGRYDYGFDYRNKITRLLMNSIEYKTWDELGLTDYINNLQDKLKQYNWGSDVDEAGLIFLPKQLVDKYLIPKETKAISAEKWVTPKIQKNKQKTKYDASGIDTPNDPTM